MSYQVLARKWRPSIFREMVGQEHVLQALINALDHDRLHHAYLFTGTRGVGKTTVARILAKCLNCERGVTSEPCGDCGSCREIAEGRSVDLIEVDAASRTKVEDTRELLENVQYAPTRNRYKVYLIDEVHMLSTSSFNALLKTLEEPPPHVKFLLATTDPQKLPATVLSRCLQFNLKNMAPEVIKSHLAHVLTEEEVAFDEQALWLIGRAADGSMRDALSLTDQAIAFGNGELTETQVRSMLGTVELSFVYPLVTAVAQQDASAALQAVATLAEHAPDFESSLVEMIALLHRVAIAQAVPDAVDDRWGDQAQVLELAAGLTAEDVQLFYQMALNGRRDLSLASDLRSGLEMVLLRMIAFKPALVIDDDLMGASFEAAAEAAASAKKPEPASPAELAVAPQPVRDPRVASEVAAEVATEVATEVTTEIATEAVVDVTAEVAVKAPITGSTSVQGTPLNEARDGAAVAQSDAQVVVAGEGEASPQGWPQLLDSLGLGGILYTIASHMELRQVDGDELVLVLDENNASLYSEGQAAKLAQRLTEALGRPMSVAISIGACATETPARRAQRLLDERQAQAVAAIEADPRVQLLMEQFGGTLDRASIAPVKH